MKIRLGFVSNSSSSSFIASLSVLSEKEKQSIMEYCKNPELNKDYWSVNEDKEKGLLVGYTSMDNGSFGEWLIKEGLNKVLFDNDGGY